MCVFLNPPPVCLCVRVRCVLHHHAVVPVEGDGHHAGELSASLHPQVPEETLLTAQLLQADHITTLEEPGAWSLDPVCVGPQQSQLYWESEHGFSPSVFFVKMDRDFGQRQVIYLQEKRKKKASVDKQVFVP